MPESVKLGRRGKVAILFSIVRDGKVQQGDSRPHPAPTRWTGRRSPRSARRIRFPPLPAEFKGDRVVLQFNFAYNMPKQ